MTHPTLTRAHIEAVLVGLAAMRPEVAPELYALLQNDHLSPAAVALLEAVLDEPAVAWTCLPQLAKTKGQHDLATRAFDLSAKDLTLWPPAVWAALANQLPSTIRPREAAWERDLAVAQESAA